jgi:hypothetical protein
MPKKRTSARTRHERAKRQGIAALGGYEAQIGVQRGCAVCGKIPQPGQRRLSIDHNHHTGQVRALLCMAHNRGIGYFLDNPDHLMTASFLLSYGWAAACAYRDALKAHRLS